VIDGRFHVESIDTTDHFVDGAESEFRHQFAYFLGKETEEVFDELRLA